MKSEPEMNFPIRFNPLKHHRSYILKALQENASETIIDLLESICNNYIDIYTGDFTPEEIGVQLAGILESINKLSQMGWRNKRIPSNSVNRRFGMDSQGKHGKRSIHPSSSGPDRKIQLPIQGIDTQNGLNDKNDEPNRKTNNFVGKDQSG